MRQILVDHARAGKRIKRGWGCQHLPLESATDEVAAAGDEQSALNDALLDLRKIDPQRFKVVALHCFVGLTAEETAAACGVSLSTVKRRWCEARIWLQRALTGDASQGSYPAT
jgi:RNA polymerase sigma factor (TIGR02999 family)